MIEKSENIENNWFYEEQGQRKGPFSESDIIEFIKSSVISRGTSVWKKGFPEWLKVENTDLRIYIDDSSPPPLIGEHINNNIIWVLAFAPIIGYFLESIFAGIVNMGNPVAAEIAMQNSKYFFITIALNIGLGILDEKKLESAGHNTSNFKGWVWLVPVYLYQRAKATEQSPTYFIVWILCFLISLYG